MKKFLFEYVIRFLIPFLSILITHYLFILSEWITPLGQIKDSGIKWALDLAFNTSLLLIFYEIIKIKVKPKFRYAISITNIKGQNSIVLDEEEAEHVISINCRITISKETVVQQTSNVIKINYPKWLTLEIDNIDHIDQEAIKNHKNGNSIVINPNLLFNFNIIDTEIYEINFKVAPRVISKKKGSIQSVIEPAGWKDRCIASYTKDFEIEIL